MTTETETETSATKRFRDADTIWNGGASNRYAVAKALLNAVDECRNEGNYNCDDAAVWLILDHLCFLVGLPQPSFQLNNDEMGRILTTLAEKKRQLGAKERRCNANSDTLC